MNISQNDTSKSESRMLNLKRERVMSDTTMNVETNNEDDEFQIIKPSTKYADGFFLNFDFAKNLPHQSSEVARVSCTCKSSQCLKLYCECFSSMLTCDPKVCSCKNCFNNDENSVNIL
jgi:hypothetical protein